MPTSKRPTKKRRGSNRRCATPEQALEVADALDKEGDEEGKRLAAEIRRQVAASASHTQRPHKLVVEDSTATCACGAWTMAVLGDGAEVGERHAEHVEEAARRPSPWQLWVEAGGSLEEPGAANAAAYIGLMVAHGYRIRRDRSGPIERDEFLHLWNDARLTAFEARPVGDAQVTFIDHAKNEGVTTGFLCRGRGSRGYSPCQDCGHFQHEYLCDFEIGEPCSKCKGVGEREEPVSYFKTIVELVKCHDCSGTGKGTCSRKLCRQCRRKFGKLDICKAHIREMRARAGIANNPKPPINVRWVLMGSAFPCWRCQKLAPGDQPAMYFPKKQRAMCAPCGDVGVVQGVVNPLNTKEEAKAL